MISEFEKEKVFWTRKMNLKLVKFIESRPNIWNPKHPKYTSVKFRDQTYAEFASKYDNEFTGQAVKDRWTNIRSTFANYLRKLNASRLKGDCEEYKVNWHLWEPCQFLMKVNRKIKGENTDAGAEDCDDKDELYQDEAGDWVSQDDNSSENDEETNELRCKDVANSLVDVLKGVQNDAFGLDNTRNGNIGQVVAKKLSLMNSHVAAKASMKIMEILLLYDEHNPHNPNNFKSDGV